MARDCKILHQFISSTFDPTNCCTLQPGLNCGNAGHATSLILKSQGPDFFVTTDLPTLINALILIPRLSYLQLSNNSLAGHIPDSIAQLTAVQYLYLDLNNFVGVVPAAIASMPSLVQLNLDDNFLIGPVPDLAGATKLNSVTMNGNCFMAGTTTWTGGSYTPATRGDCATNPIILAEEAALTASASGAASTAASGSSSTTAVFQPSPTAGISTAQDSNASSSSTTPSTSVIAAIIGVVVLAAALLVAAFVVFHRRRMGARGRTPKTPQNAEVRGGQYPDGAHSFAGVAYPPPQQRSAGSDDVSTPFITASTASSPPLFMMPSAATPAPPLRSTSTAGSNFQATWVPSHDGDAGPAGAVAMGTMRKPSTLFGKVIERGYTVGESSDGGQGAGSWITGHPGSSDGAQDPESWTTADVKSWLLRSGFDRGIADTFELHGIAGKQLVQLTVESLQNHLGIAPDAAGLIFFAKSSLSSGVESTWIGTLIVKLHSRSPQRQANSSMGIDCTTATCQVVLSYIIPALGDVTGLLLFLAPIPAVRLALAQGKLGSLNPIPFALITVNCLGWIVYGLYIKNYFVFVTNWIGWALGTWFCLSLRPLMPAAQVRIVEVILLGVSMAVYLLSAISFISLGEESAKLTLGFMTNVILVAFYGSPLTVMWEVVRERDSSGLNTAIAVTSLINSSLWVVYGQVIVDWFITVPNALGVIFSVTQLILLGIYPRRKANAAAGAPASTSEKNLTLEAGEPEIIQIEDDVPDVEGNYLKAR